MGLAIGHTTSAAEELAKMASGARVVKAFNTVFAHIYESGNLKFGRQRINIPICSDNEDAKVLVGMVVESLGLMPLDAGPLQNARFIEPHAALLILLAFKHGMGPNIAWKLLRR
jgi:predicted dinucleotide-binding enzyme